MNNAVVTEIKNRTQQPIPDGLIDALNERSRWRQYSSGFQEIFFLVEEYGREVAGVAGDGANAWYEWFIWSPEKKKLLCITDQGWGCPGTALRAALQSRDWLDVVE